MIVSGNVIDSRTNKPIANVTVLTTGTSTQTFITGSNGQFRLDVPEFPTQLKIITTNYSPYSKTLTRAEQNILIQLTGAYAF